MPKESEPFQHNKHDIEGLNGFGGEREFWWRSNQVDDIDDFDDCDNFDEIVKCNQFDPKFFKHSKVQYPLEASLSLGL